MSKWKVTGIDPIESTRGNELIMAGCRYLNTATFPRLEELASILGIEVDSPEETTEKRFIGEVDEDGEYSGI